LNITEGGDGASTLQKVGHGYRQWQSQIFNIEGAIKIYFLGLCPYYEQLIEKMKFSTINLTI
jgi:hypothetical protein